MVEDATGSVEVNVQQDDSWEFRASLHYRPSFGPGRKGIKILSLSSMDVEAIDALGHALLSVADRKRAHEARQAEGDED